MLAFPSQGTFGKVWGHCWLSQLGEGATDVGWVDASVCVCVYVCVCVSCSVVSDSRDVAEHPPVTTHRTAAHP